MDAVIELDATDIAELVQIEEQQDEKGRTRSGAPNKSSERTIKSFLDGLATKYPHFIGDCLHLGGDVAVHTMLSRIIMEVEYTPSKIDILADHKGLARKGFIMDADLCKMTLRNMNDHCSRLMLDELEAIIHEHEAKLLSVLTEPFDTPATEIVPTAAPTRRTAIVNDEMLGRIEIDCDTAEVIRIIDDNDAVGDILVDDSEQVDVTQDVETAKQSRVWASW